MAYPTLEQYNQSLQNPQFAFTDPELQKGSVKTTGLGLPLASCGGFALTYEITCSGKKYAVRCFHKESKDLEKRYTAISRKIKELNSDYFVNEFSFQSDGFKLQNKPVAPIVKMAWAEGDVLGQFVEDNYDNPTALANLRKSLENLAEFLEYNHIAHGDIQPGNIMVADEGKKVQLIDYDGMFVEELKDAGSSEMGKKNFQHPQRSNQWDATLDRFSFILIDLSLSLLEKYPDLWDETGSDIEIFLFSANDIYNPDGSKLFNDLKNLDDYQEKVERFSNICKSNFDKIPSLKEYLYGKPKPKKIVIKKIIEVPTSYIPTFEVLDATNYDLCLENVGERVELVGQIQDMRKGYTVNGKPYVFINFGIWTPTSKLVRLTIWNECLERFIEEPNHSWIGKWVSVSGLIEPPFRKGGYASVGITITHPSLIHEIDKDETDYRLGRIKRITTQVIEEEVEDEHWQENERLLELSKTLMYQKKFNDAKKALDKVFQTGNDEQKQQAQNLLSQIEELEQKENERKAKIDNYLVLANKEITNNNFEQAKFYIQEVLERGDNEQKQRAKNLLTKIKELVELERKEQQRKAKIDNYLVLANKEITNNNFEQAKFYIQEVLERGDNEQKQRAKNLLTKIEELVELERKEQERKAKIDNYLVLANNEISNKNFEQAKYYLGEVYKLLETGDLEQEQKAENLFAKIDELKEKEKERLKIDSYLDLARYYITCKQFYSANNYLNKVIQKGDSNQQQIAKELLSEINRLEQAEKVKKKREQERLAKIEEMNRYLIFAENNIRVNNFEKAKSYINEIIQHGDDSQKQRANILLEQIKIKQKQENKPTNQDILNKIRGEFQKVETQNSYFVENSNTEENKNNPLILGIKPNTTEELSNQDILDKIREKFQEVEPQKPQFIELSNDVRSVDNLLDLANVELHSGNFDKARNILNEVIQKGDENQKEKARTLFNKLEQEQRKIEQNQKNIQEKNIENQKQSENKRTYEFDLQSQEAINRVKEKVNYQPAERQPYQDALDEILTFINNARYPNGEPILDKETILRHYEIEQTFINKFNNEGKQGIENYKNSILKILERKVNSAEREIVEKEIAIVGITEKQRQKLEESQKRIEIERQRMIEEAQRKKQNEERKRQEERRLQQEEEKNNSGCLVIMVIVAILYFFFFR